jgi:hypothetical protein
MTSWIDEELNLMTMLDFALYAVRIQGRLTSMNFKMVCIQLFVITVGFFPMAKADELKTANKINLQKDETVTMAHFTVVAPKGWSYQRTEIVNNTPIREWISLSPSKDFTDTETSIMISVQDVGLTPFHPIYDENKSSGAKKYSKEINGLKVEVIEVSKPNRSGISTDSTYGTGQIKGLEIAFIARTPKAAKDFSTQKQTADKIIDSIAIDKSKIK